MKRVLNTFIGLAMTTSLCWAADTVDIDVTVTTDAAACTPTLSNNGIVDFGKQSAARLSGTHYTQWGSKGITLNITCEASTAVAISARDSRTDSLSYGADANGNVGPQSPLNGQGTISNPARLFGLGKTVEGKNIGSYAIVLETDGVQVQDGSNTPAVGIVGSASVDGPWSADAVPALPSDLAWYYTFAIKNSTTVQPITTATVPLNVSASIANDLSSGSSILLNGQATISLIYL